jgi:hypothetical protein
MNSAATITWEKTKKGKGIDFVFGVYFFLSSRTATATARTTAIIMPTAAYMIVFE